MYVTEDTTRADPDSLRRLYSTAVRAGAKRVCVADTVGHATPAGAAAVVRFIGSVSTNAAAASGSTGTGTATATSPSRTRWPRSRREPPGCTAPPSASASASGTRRWTRCSSTSCSPGYLDRDLTALVEYCETVSAATGVAIPPNYPVVGRDAFRTATGVHAAAVIKAFRKGDLRSGRCGVFGRAGGDGRAQPGDRDRPDVGEIERRLLAGEARPGGRTERSSIASSPRPRRRRPC